MNKLNGSRSVRSNKISGYLLNLDHKDGAGKAKFFMKFGFDLDGCDELAQALLLHADDNEVESTCQTEYGEKNIVRCHLRTPDQRNPCIVTVWIRESGQEDHTLVTAYASEK